ncbi:MAG: hypothetical protein EPN61_14865 [Burkholderiaceae bacterium]|nr:MAG: hypothetical protein EPN61_14865 [Burkholderiaceae bacterium]
MRPADSSNHQSLRFVDRDDLTSLIGVVNNAFKRQLDETRKAARDVVHAAHALHAPNVSFAEELVAEALWPAAAKDVLVATLDHAATPPKASGGASFGEGAAGLDRKSP